MSADRYARVPLGAAGDPELTATDLRVLLTLGKYADRTGKCWPSQPTIARDIGAARQTVSAAIGKLERLTYIKVRRERRGLTYWIVFEEQRDLDLAPPETRPDEATTSAPDDGGRQRPMTGDVSQRRRPIGTNPENHPTEPGETRERAHALAGPSEHAQNRKPATKRRRAEPTDVIAELRQVLDEERAAAVVEHRRTIRKPLTAHAARLLARSFGAAPDPNAAADVMIGRGWQGFDVGWNGAVPPPLPPNVTPFPGPGFSGSPPQPGVIDHEPVQPSDGRSRRRPTTRDATSDEVLAAFRHAAERRGAR